MPFIESLGSSLPAHEVLQSDVRKKAEEVLAGLAPELLPKLDIFDHTGIRKRHFVRPLDWFMDPHGWKERADIFRSEGTSLAVDASRRALDAAALQPTDIDGVVFVTTTGIATPSLDASLVNAMGMRPDVMRLPLWGLGCVGGVAGLNVAADLARAHPEKRFLFVSLELCSLSFDLGDMSVRAFVANTLFADGCAAVVVRGDDTKGRALGRLDGHAMHTWPGTERVMGWDVADNGLRVVFSRRIPEIVRVELPPIVERFVKASGSPPDRYVFHPGGAKVLEAYEAGLGLGPTALESARHALREYGNMSSPTVFFALEESLRSPLRPGETAMLAALGPGFTSSLAMLSG